MATAARIVTGVRMIDVSFAVILTDLPARATESR